MIASCPSCGTHYKHEPPEAPSRARCGRCDATLDLSRLRPYRIVSLAAADPADTARAARHLPIGLDHPALATTIARNLERSPASGPPAVTTLVEAPATTWDEDDPLPAIPEMATLGAFEPSVPPVSESDILGATESEADDFEMPDSNAGAGMGERITTFALWVAAGAIVGTGSSWTIGGTTLAGLIAGGAFGAVTGWGWLKWMSSK